MSALKSQNNSFFYSLLFCALLLGFAIFNLWFIAPVAPLMWDEATYIGIGKHIYTSGSIGLWETIRPLGLPLVLGAVWKIGLGQQVVYRLVTLGFAISLLCVTYLLCKTMMRPIAALFAACLLGLTPLFFGSSTNILTDIPSSFFSILSLLFLARNKFFFSGISAGLAFFFRFPQGLIVAALIISVLVWQKKKQNCLQILAGFLCIILPFLVFNQIYYGSPIEPLREASSHQDNLVYSIPGFSENIMFYINTLITQNVLYFLVFPGLLFALREKNTAAIAFLIYISYFTWIVNKQDRFALSFLPLAAILCGLYMDRAVKHLSRLSSKFQVVFGIFFGLIVFYAALNMAWTDIGHYRWISSTEDKLVQFYSFTNNSAVLSTEPRIAAFTDSKVLSYYEGPEESMQSYEDQKSKASFIVYTPHYYPCEKLSQSCEARKKELFDKIISENKLLLNATDGTLKYYVFSRAT